MSVQVYCPIVREVRFWNDRKKTVETPLIKSYVFIKSRKTDRSVAFSVPRVERYLFWLGRPAIVRDEEIAVLKDWVDNDTVEDIVYSKLQSGDRATIRRGPLKNQVAVVRHVGRNRVSLVLDDIGIVVSAKLNEVA